MELTDTSRMVLVRAEVFMDLPTGHLAIIRRFLEEHHAPAGQTLFREGDGGDKLFVVRRGRVRMERVRDGVLYEIGRRGPGETIGETALIDSSPRTVTVVCDTDSDFFMLSREAFYQILANNPEIATRILRVLAGRLRDADAASVQELEVRNRELEVERDRLTLQLREAEADNDRLEETRASRECALVAFPYPAIVTDTSNRPRWVNPAALRLLGDPGSSVLWNWVRPVAPDMVQDIETSLRRDETWSGELDVADASNRVLLCHVIAVPVPRADDGTEARLWIFEDRTEIRALEEETLQRNRLATKSEMAGEIAHEVNNSLAVLSGNAELLEMHLGGQLNERAGRCLSNIRQSVERMHVFTENLLRSRQPGGQKIPTEINAFLEAQVAFLRPQKKFKKVLIKTDWGPDLPPVTCDPLAMQQVLYNVVLNAAEALAETGGVHSTVWIETKFVPESKVVRLRIADDGPGIPATLLDSLFQRRVSTKQARHGFGLFTVGRVVKDHGGSIRAGARVEGGAEFTIDLPVGTAKM